MAQCLKYLVIWLLKVVNTFILILGENHDLLRKVEIGALLVQAEPDGVVVNMAKQYINSHPHILPNVTLDIHIELVADTLDKFKHIQKACSLMERGVVGVVGPMSSTAVKVTQPLFAGLHIPQVAPTATDPSLSTSSDWNYPYLLKMSPPDTKQSAAIADLIKTYGWTSFAVLTSNTDYGTNGLMQLYSIALANNWVILRMEKFKIGPDFGQVNATQELSRIKEAGARVIVLNSDFGYGWIVLGQAKAMGMFAKGWAWIVTDGMSVRNITTLTVDGNKSIEDFVRKALYSHLPQYQQQNVSDCTSVAAEFEGLLGTVASTGNKESKVYKEFRSLWRASQGNSTVPTSYSMLLFDSVLALAYALNEYIRDGNRLAPPQADQTGICSTRDFITWQNGSAVMEYLSELQVEGTSHFLNFTSNNLPCWSNYDIVNLQNFGWLKIADWSQENAGIGLKLNKTPLFPGRTDQVPQDVDIDMSNVFFRVTTILEKPFVMEDDTGQLIGVCIDLVKRLSEELGFSYEISLVKDHEYGLLNKDTMRWNGMVGEVLDHEADMAVASVLITQEREGYVDFTTPWYDLGLDVLLPLENQRFNLFDFFDPFDLPLWIAVIVSTYVCGFVVSACSFFSPFGYKGKYTQRQNKHDHKYRERKNELNPNNGVFFAFSSLLRQGPSTTPISVSGRIVSGFWWLAVTILTASYTANLTAYLTVERLDTGVSSLSELAAQTEIKYGTINGTAVSQYFKENNAEPFPKMYQFMNTYETWMPNGSSAIQRVQDSNEKYACIFDSTILEYAAKNEPCNTRTLGDIFRRVGYGIFLQKNSPYVTYLDSAILNLRENGAIETLMATWIQGPCQSPSSDASANKQQLTLYRMLGIFLVLGGGLVLGFVLIAVEYVCAGYRDVVEDRLQGRPAKSWWFHVKRRLRDTMEELQEQYCIFTCCRKAYSLNDSRRFSAQFGNATAINNRTAKTVNIKARQPSYGNSKTRSMTVKGRKNSFKKHPSAHSHNSFNSIAAGNTSPIFNTHAHIMELCKKSDIPVNGAVPHQSEPVGTSLAFVEVDLTEQDEEIMTKGGDMMENSTNTEYQ